MKMMHVTIQTARFEEEKAFYENQVGLTLVGDLRPMGKDLIFLANGEGETCIEIIRVPEAENSGNLNLSIGFHTEDVKKKREEMIAEGFEVTPMISPSPDVKFFFVTDPAGVRVQFI
jgi:lactoylglutathione lyase